MCRFKSGIILKTRCVIAEGADDSHSNLLEKLNIEDTTTNAMTRFVKVELLPPNGKWWTDPDTWRINVDQDILPDWYKDDPEKYNAEFQQEVKDWWNGHVFIDQKIDELSSGYYRLKRCEVKKLFNDVQVMCDSSIVQEMWDNSTVQEMYGRSTVQEMWDNSTVQEMRDSSTVQEMYDGSIVQMMRNNSIVQEMHGRSTVKEMHNSSTVQAMYGRSTVQEMCDSSTVQEMCDRSTVQEMCDRSTVQEMRDSSTVREMCDDSTVQKMHERSIAISYQIPNKVQILASSEKEVEFVVHENLKFANIGRSGNGGDRAAKVSQFETKPSCYQYD